MNESEQALQKILQGIAELVAIEKAEIIQDEEDLIEVLSEFRDPEELTQEFLELHTKDLTEYISIHLPVAINSNKREFLKLFISKLPPELQNHPKSLSSLI